MSGHNLSADGELRYIIQWFNEWSELQRDDFLPIFSEYAAKGTISNGGINLNGVIGGMAAINCDDKPMSLFQCRVKLFREWCAKWPEDLKTNLQEKLFEIDRTFAEKLEHYAKTGTISSLMNEAFMMNGTAGHEGNGLLEAATSPQILHEVVA